MQKILLQIIISISLLLSSYSTLNAEEKNYKIIKLVNNNVITNYDLEQRLKLYSTLNNADINEENIDKLANQMLSLMVDEKLQLEQINSYGISVNKSEINDYIERAYLSDNNNLNEFIDTLNNNNIDIAILKKSIEVMIGWNKLTGRLYYRTSEINKVDLENLMNVDSSLSKEQAEDILLQKQISLRAKKLLRDIRIEANIENR
ncbi:SurA N-terminal domain-containing protein [Pelagibacterales bacterium]|nr:SurA N-terminal domain-containing protein [Pelagibacterales bacterium]